MTTVAPSSAQPESTPDLSNDAARRRRMRYRAWHRGMRETDLLVGSFADLYLDGFTPRQLDSFEALLDVADADLLDWYGGRKQIAPAHENDVTALLMAHHSDTTTR